PVQNRFGRNVFSERPARTLQALGARRLGFSRTASSEARNERNAGRLRHWYGPTGCGRHLVRKDRPLSKWRQTAGNHLSRRQSGRNQARVIIAPKKLWSPARLDRGLRAKRAM